jgi:hypothetical protein
MARMANQKISPTQIVGARANTMFPHTVVGTLSDYPSRLAVTCECDHRDYGEDSDEGNRHCDPGPASIHRAFVMMPTIPVMIR